ncbi:hypothetical protein MTR_5g038725 [Medicago truncatula]|uniref:Uncharacterized protein n=1 Tax=Medicago truncatula TaxID=3880 RepID=A0A072UDW6_MEDTR|nr:hypothetical protein MTR_5g038725 [Medicago truncatula]
MAHVSSNGLATRTPRQTKYYTPAENQTSIAFNKEIEYNNQIIRQLMESLKFQSISYTIDQAHDDEFGDDEELV